MYTSEEFQAWKEHPVTKEFVKSLQENIYNIQDDLGSGGTISTDAQAALVMTAKAVGMIEGIKLTLDFIDPTPDPAMGDFYEEESDA